MYELAIPNHSRLEEGGQELMYVAIEESQKSIIKVKFI